MQLRKLCFFKYIRKLSLFFLFITGANLMAQTRLSVYTDIGKNNVSDGIFINTAGFARYQFGKNAVEAGVRMNLISNNKRTFSGYRISASRELLIKEFPLEAQSFFVFTPFSDILHESSWGIRLSAKHKHMAISIGTNFRTYSYSQKAIRDYDFEENTSIHENWNLMYLFSYHLNPPDKQWNLALSITNTDHYIINQETNPCINLRADYKPASAMNIYIESWYKSAGAFNLSVNYFGFFFRTGIIWNIN